MFDSFFSLFSHDLGIDLGPAESSRSPFQFYSNTAYGAIFGGRAVLRRLNYV